MLLSPAELSYLRTSLAQTPPIRADGRAPTEFRPLVAEQDILPSTNGSARVCFADGTEAIVGVKAEVQQTESLVADYGTTGGADDVEEEEEDGDGGGNGNGGGGAKGMGKNEWVDLSIEIPGYRDDDGLPIFISAALTEALLAGGALKDRLFINRRYHWKLYIDVCYTPIPSIPFSSRVCSPL